MFFNWVNLDTKLRVAILGQDFDGVVTLFRFLLIGIGLYLLDIYSAFVYLIVQWFNLYSVFGSLLYFLLDLLLQLSAALVTSRDLEAEDLCCEEFYRHHGDDEEAPPRSPLPRRRAEADAKSQRSPLPRRRSSNSLDSTNPPLTVYSGNPTDISGTSTAHNKNIVSRSRSPIVRRPIVLRSQSLPKLRRRRHHRTKRSEAPIVSAPTTVTLPDTTVNTGSASRSNIAPAISTGTSGTAPIPQALVPKFVQTTSKASSVAYPHRQVPVAPVSSLISATKQPMDTPVISTASASRPSRPDPTNIADSLEYTYVTASSSEDSSSEELQHSKAIQITTPTTLQPDPLQLKAQLPLSKACDSSISVQQFQQWTQQHGLLLFDKRRCDDERPFRCLCIFGPPKAGKSTAGASMNIFIQGTQVSTTSEKFHKYVNENNNTNMFHYTNDSFAKQETVDFHRLYTSIQSVLYSTPGRHFLVVEGHRIFESEEVMDLSNYVVAITGKPATLRDRVVPTPESSLSTYQTRIRPHLPESTVPSIYSNWMLKHRRTLWSRR